MKTRTHAQLLRPFLLAAIAAAAWTGCISFADLARTEEPMPTAGRCGECHGAVYAEWRASPHAEAFSSRAFLLRTDGGTIEECLPCHAPRIMPAAVATRPAAARTSRREEGVHCLACHRVAAGHGSEGSAAMAGPLGKDALVQPHPVQELAEWYRDARFCGRCHEDTLTEWQGSDQAYTCQQCHMPAVDRKVTQATDLLSRALVAFEEKQELRAHEFSAAAACAESSRMLGGDFVEVRSITKGNQLALHVVNHLPHALPTGGFGGGIVRIEVQVPGAALTCRTLWTRRGMALAPGAALDIPLPDEAKGNTASIELVRRAGSDARPLVLWRGEVSIPVTAPREEEIQHPSPP